MIIKRQRRKTTQLHFNIIVIFTYVQSIKIFYTHINTFVIQIIFKKLSTICYIYICTTKYNFTSIHIYACHTNHSKSDVLSAFSYLKYYYHALNSIFLRNRFLVAVKTLPDQLIRHINRCYFS